MAEKILDTDELIERYENDESIDSLVEDSQLSKSGLTKKIYRNTDYRQREQREKRNCERCGDLFKPDSSPEQNYCSRECFTKSEITSEKITVNCDNPSCEKEKTITLNTFNSQDNHYCSTECYHAHRSENLVGKNNPNWKSGSSYEEYPVEFNSSLKRKVREKDNYTCQICGIAQKNSEYKLDVHHLDENKSNLNMQNLTALCRSCHSHMQNSEQAKKLLNSKHTMSYKKGYRRENQCVKLLEKCGFEAERSQNPAYSSGDYFGLFDVIAMRKDRKPRLIQVKSNRTDGAMKEILESEFIPETHFEVEIWVAYDNDGWRVERMNAGEWTTLIDERNLSKNYGAEVKEKYE